MSFLRSKLKNADKVAQLLSKVDAIYQAGKKNVFNVEFKGQRFEGIKMTNLDLTTDPTKVTFTYEAKDYELVLADLKLVDRVRSRKYLFKTLVLTEVVAP